MSRPTTKKRVTHRRQIAASLFEDFELSPFNSQIREAAETEHPEPSYMKALSQLVLDSDSEQHKERKPIGNAGETGLVTKKNDRSKVSDLSAQSCLAAQSTWSKFTSSASDHSDSSFEWRPMPESGTKKFKKTKSIRTITSKKDNPVGSMENLARKEIQVQLPTLGEENCHGSTVRHEMRYKVLLETHTRSGNDSVKEALQPNHANVAENLPELQSSMCSVETAVGHVNDDLLSLSGVRMCDVATQVSLCPCPSLMEINNRKKTCEVSIQTCLCDCSESMVAATPSLPLFVGRCLNATVCGKTHSLDEIISHGLSKVQISDLNENLSDADQLGSKSKDLTSASVGCCAGQQSSDASSEGVEDISLIEQQNENESLITVCDLSIQTSEKSLHLEAQDAFDDFIKDAELDTTGRSVHMPKSSLKVTECDEEGSLVTACNVLMQACEESFHSETQDAVDEFIEDAAHDSTGRSLHAPESSLEVTESDEEGSLVMACDVSIQACEESLHLETLNVSNDLIQNAVCDYTSTSLCVQEMLHVRNSTSSVAESDHPLTEIPAMDNESLVTVCDVSLQTSPIDSGDVVGNVDGKRDDTVDAATEVYQTTRENTHQEHSITVPDSPVQHLPRSADNHAKHDYSLHLRDEDFNFVARRSVPGADLMSSTMAHEQISGTSFFGVNVSPVGGIHEGTGKSPAGSAERNNKRRQSKHGKKRVSMCAELVESPEEEFFTPTSMNRTQFLGELTTIVDSDVSGNETAFKTVCDSRMGESSSSDHTTTRLDIPLSSDIASGDKKQTMKSGSPLSPLDQRESTSATNLMSSSRKRVDFSDSEGDEDFEKFVRTIKSSPAALSRRDLSINAFIIPDDVSDSNATESSDDESSEPCGDQKSDEDAESNDDEDSEEVFTDESDKENLPEVPLMTTSKGSNSLRNKTRQILGSLSDSDDDIWAPPKNVTTAGRATSTSNRTMATPKPTELAVPHTVSHCQRPHSFLKSLSQDVPDYLRNLDASRYVKQFSKLRVELTAKLFRIYNSTVFEDQLPADLPITWNSRLTKTAGFCRYITDTVDRSKKHASIELSVKVCDSAERLRDTLIHELCHAVVWYVNKVRDGHGNFWKFWVSKANRTHRDLPPIKRCHSYEINTKFVYKCTRCGYEVRRHSKSLDIDAKVCGYCAAPFQLLKSGPNSENAGNATPRTPNKFALFVKENFVSVKRSNPGLGQAAIMGLVSAKYSEAKLKK